MTFNIFLWTFGYYSVCGKIHVKKVVTNPNIVALFIGLAVFCCPVKLPQVLSKSMEMIASLNDIKAVLETDVQAAYEVLETYVGKDLEYKEYEPLFACAKEVADKQNKKGFFVTCDNYVTMSDGTGIVHIAPAFGEDDAKVGRKYDLPFVQLVDGKGEMTPGAPAEGLFVKKADPVILQILEDEGKLFDAPKFEHDYPHCWRCDTPLI